MKKDWKYYAGMALLAYSILPYVFVFLVLPFLDVSATASLSVATILLASAEVAFLIAVALLGKPFIQLIKDKIRALFRRGPSAAPPRPVGRTRHMVGVAMLLASMVIPTLLIESLLLFDLIDRFGHNNALYVLVGFDALFVASLFVLGGDFWDRLKKLFEWPGTERQT